MSPSCTMLPSPLMGSDVVDSFLKAGLQSIKAGLDLSDALKIKTFCTVVSTKRLIVQPTVVGQTRLSR